jgi:hypothetical protein
MKHFDFLRIFAALIMNHSFICLKKLKFLNEITQNQSPSRSSDSPSQRSAVLILVRSIPPLLDYVVATIML